MFLIGLGLFMNGLKRGPLDVVSVGSSISDVDDAYGPTNALWWPRSIALETPSRLREPDRNCRTYNLTPCEYQSKRVW